MQISKIHSFRKLPQSLFRKNSNNILLIYDQKLGILSPRFLKWSRSFLCYPVRGGESLKDIHTLPFHIGRILEKTKGLSSSSLHVVAVGGGSVGDFSGFVASTLKRGVSFTQIPTTWLAAVDSAHGGKTALNVPPFKNQVGTFYPAEDIYLIEELLFLQPDFLAKQALSEVIKMGLIEGGELWKKLFLLAHKKTSPRRISRVSEKKFSKIVWTLLHPVIMGKWKVIKKDPYEKKGIRQVLNLGHTMGHVLEGLKGLSHAESVLQGLFFTIEWSSDLGLMSKPKETEILSCLKAFEIKKKKNFNLNSSDILQSLFQDKKAYDKEHINFVFLKAPGKYLIQKVPYQDILKQVHRQNWLL